MDAITAFDLTKEYGELVALAGLNLQVPQGEAFACVGEKGCGKTTLIRLLSGLARPTSGECTVLGLSPSYEAQKLHTMVGTVLESAKLYAGMTLWENLRFFAGLHGMDDNDSLERSSFLLHKLDIWEGRDLPVQALPTGVARRASLARAMMHSPKVLLVDEPSGVLDQDSLDAIAALLSYASREEGTTLFLCSSHMGVAQMFGQAFGFMKNGMLLARGDLETLRQGAGVRFRAQLRLGEGEVPAGFEQVDGLWEKEIDSQDDMPKIIAHAVEEGYALYEARLVRPSLKEIYTAWMEGGRRKVGEFYESADQEQEDGDREQEGEAVPNEDGGEDAPQGEEQPQPEPEEPEDEERGEEV